MSEKRVTPADELSVGAVLEYPAPEGMEGRARDYLSNPDAFEVAEPRLASTVMLLRPAQAAPLEVFMLRRASTMAFVPDACVFPGGSADARDDVCEVPMTGPSIAAWSQALGCDEISAKRAIIAAARELFEECGVLLASDESGAFVGGAPGDGRHLEDRRRLAHHEIPFGAYLMQHNLHLRSDLLCARAHWTTPPCEPRRYSTYFFTARLPEGQLADGLTSEATASAWVEPHVMLKQAREGQARVMPPTVANLAELSRARTIEDACACTRVRHVMLVPQASDDGSIMLRSVIK